MLKLGNQILMHNSLDTHNDVLQCSLYMQKEKRDNVTNLFITNNSLHNTLATALWANILYTFPVCKDFLNDFC